MNKFFMSIYTNEHLLNIFARRVYIQIFYAVSFTSIRNINTLKDLVSILRKINILENFKL